MIEIIYDHRMPLRGSAIRHFIIHKGTIILLSHFLSFYFKCFKVAAVMLVIDLVVKWYRIRIFSGDIIHNCLFETASKIEIFEPEQIALIIYPLKDCFKIRDTREYRGYETGCPDNGRPSMNPVMLIKVPFIQYLYGIKSMRQTMKEIEVNVAYRWFLGLDMLDPIPHFSTFGKNYTRRFKDTDLFEQIFSKILEDCMKYNLVNTGQIFVDATHVKACANSKKMRKRVAHEQALWYEEELNKEIEKDRLAHGKKALKKKDDNQPPASGGNGNNKDSKEEKIPEDVKTQKCSTSDPESGWFRKGEHKHVFAYAVETACDKRGWILGYTVHPGNEHDSRTFKALYDKISKLNPQMVVADAGYKTPAIAHRLLEDGIQPLFRIPVPRPKKAFSENTPSHMMNTMIVIYVREHIY